PRPHQRSGAARVGPRERRLWLCRSRTVGLMHAHGEERFGAAAQAAEWDARYSERDGAMRSGRPNGRLVAEVADLVPGRAHAVGPRIDPPPGNPHVADVVVRARRR